jgi:thiamine pyrophosphokinase
MAGGPEEYLPSLEPYQRKDSIWVGADSGVNYLLKRGIVPDAAFGDFDSVTGDDLTRFEEEIPNLKKFMPEKDETDMELAFNWALEQEPEGIHLFGASGGRLDHLLANIQLIVKPLLNGCKIPIKIIDRKNIVSARMPGIFKVRRDSMKKYVSFIPATLTVSGLTLSGFKYPLENSHISVGSTLCISNELIEEYGTFSFSEGILIVIRSQD